jgi:hypothetical protein
MTSNDGQGGTVRRKLLPSGRSIEVWQPADTEPQVRELHLCPACGSDLVQPIAWNETENASWQLTLECPNCRWLEHGVYCRDQVERLEDQIDDGVCDMLADLHRLTQANMADEIERFVGALHADRILPEDF